LLLESSDSCFLDLRVYKTCGVLRGGLRKTHVFMHRL